MQKSHAYLNLRVRCEDNIKMQVRRLGCERSYKIQITQDMVNYRESGDETKASIKARNF